MKHKHIDIITDIALAHATSQSTDHLCFSQMQVVQALSRGVETKSVLLIAQHIPLQLLCDALDLSESALRRRIKLNKRLHVTEADNLLQLTKLWRALINFFNHDQQLLRSWVHAELPALEGETPARMMATNFGRKIILETLETMKYGEFA